MGRVYWWRAFGSGAGLLGMVGHTRRFNPVVAQVLPCYETLHELEGSLAKKS